MSESYTITAIGEVFKSQQNVGIRIHPAYAEALGGLSQFSHVVVLYWFHHNDTAEARRVLKVHPMGDPANPLTGVFATHSPRRPNLIAVSICRLEKIDGLMLYLDDIDALDGSPVVDLKCYVPSPIHTSEVRMAPWIKNRRT
jgi:tRNA-Thr(GGU) m(6)t(6)A37 methyltransferase TsaA